jgi:cytochrome o ubiquinol oxidase operon protein cyoD
MSSDPHAHDEFQEQAHFTPRIYLTGFAAAVVLTVIPFWIVMTHAIPGRAAAAAAVVLCAVAQIVVHTFSFLHLNAKAQGGWTLVAYIFTTVLLLITIGGSLWIMHHLDLNMMPGMTSTDFGM